VIGPGVGHDAAALAIGDHVLVAKTDPITFASIDAASYLVEINANDIACLGADPRWLLVTALLPEQQTTASLVATMFGELQTAAKRRGVSLIGGHTEITAGVDRPLLIGMMLGLTTRDRLLRPGQAQPGDRLLMTKEIALEGSALLAKERRAELRTAMSEGEIDAAVDLIHDPGLSVVDDARLVLRHGGITALHDPTEGGLATGARELATSAGVGVRIALESVPIHPATEAIAAEFDLNPLGMLASGTLLIAAQPDRVASLIATGRREGLRITEIGQVTSASEGLSLLRAGRSEPLTEFATDEVSRALAMV
jgi:hydrogenase maturation factor